jgi:hypothetical protein
MRKKCGRKCGGKCGRKCGSTAVETAGVFYAGTLLTVIFKNAGLFFRMWMNVIIFVMNFEISTSASTPIEKFACVELERMWNWKAFVRRNLK